MLGLFGWLFNKINNQGLRMYSKLLYSIICIVAFPLVSDLSGFSNAKYIGILTMSYTVSLIWKEDKPEV